MSLILLQAERRVLNGQTVTYSEMVTALVAEQLSETQLYDRWVNLNPSEALYLCVNMQCGRQQGCPTRAYTSLSESIP